MINIESNIALPTGGAGRPPKYPFKDMSAGDSVFFEGENTSSKAYFAAAACARNNNKKFTGRAVDGGLRIWCIE